MAVKVDVKMEINRRSRVGFILRYDAKLWVVEAKAMETSLTFGR